MSEPTVLSVNQRRIDAEAAGQFQEDLLTAVNAGGTVIIDFSQVEAIASVGLRALVLAWKKSRDLKTTIFVCGLRPMVRDVFTIVRFEVFFPIYDSLDEARRALMEGR